METAPKTLVSKTCLKAFRSASRIAVRYAVRFQYNDEYASLFLASLATHNGGFATLERGRKRSLLMPALLIK
jgi:hypothetical protein